MAQAIPKKETTSVEWLKKELEDFGDPTHLSISWVILDELCEQAKAVERQQIVDAFYEGMQSSMFDPNKGRALIYYNETYNK